MATNMEPFEILHNVIKHHQGLDALRRKHLALNAIPQQQQPAPPIQLNDPGLGPYSAVGSGSPQQQLVNAELANAQAQNNFYSSGGVAPIPPQVQQQFPTPNPQAALQGLFHHFGGLGLPAHHPVHGALNLLHGHLHGPRRRHLL